MTLKPLILAIFLATAPSVEIQMNLNKDHIDFLTRDLNDPESARLRDVRTSKIFPDVICGAINWRNEQGGYEGYKKFWLDPSEGKKAIEPHPAYTAWAEALGCEEPQH